VHKQTLADAADGNVRAGSSCGKAQRYGERGREIEWGAARAPSLTDGLAISLRQ